ncbi:MAG: hypothetical protein P4M07_03150, partial [Xanthobacteraceae bacterium]|nr:hypothetical protein [Xanthobacteraceae bacterium]
MMRTIWGCVAVSALLTATAVQAQTLVTDEIPAPYSSRDEVVVERGPYAALPPAGVYGYGEEIIPPFQAVRNLRATGYEPISRPVRRRFVYLVAVINPQGMEGRAVLDAHSGRILRFVPAGYGDDDGIGAYGPSVSPGPPPVPRKLTTRSSLRPPASVPHVAFPPPPAVSGKSDARPGEATKLPAGQQQAAVAPPKPAADPA